MATKKTEAQRTAQLEKQLQHEAENFHRDIVAERALTTVTTETYSWFEEIGPEDHLVARNAERLRYTLISLVRDRDALVRKMQSLADDFTRDVAKLTASVGNASYVTAPLNSSYARDVVVEFTRLEVRVRDIGSAMHEAGFYAPELATDYDRNRRTQRDRYTVEAAGDATWTLKCDGVPVQRPVETPVDVLGIVLGLNPVTEMVDVVFTSEWNAWYAFKTMGLL